MAGLVRNAQAGDKEAFVDLIESCKQGLYKTAIAMLRNDADAADAIQDAVLNSYENLQSLKETAVFQDMDHKNIDQSVQPHLKEARKHRSDP